MNLKHNVRINVTDSDGNKQAELRGGVRNIPCRIVQWLFGENLEILVLTPGQRGKLAEIYEVRKGEENYE